MRRDSSCLLVRAAHAIDNLAARADSAGRITPFNYACRRPTRYRREEVLLGHDLPRSSLPHLRCWFAGFCALDASEAQDNRPQTKPGAVT